MGLVTLPLLALAGCDRTVGGTGRLEAASTAASPGASTDPSAAAPTAGTSGRPAPQPSPTPPPRSRPPASPRPPGPGAADGSDLRACFDGTCEVVVSGPVTIPVDPSFGMAEVSVRSVGPEAVTLYARGSGYELQTSVGQGGIGTLNGLTMRVVSLSGHTAVLAFTPAGR